MNFSFGPQTEFPEWSEAEIKRLDEVLRRYYPAGQDDLNTVSITENLMSTNIPNESGTIDPVEEHDAEKLKNIRNTQPNKEVHTGVDTVSVGQPSQQKVEQEESLPAASVPVEKHFTKTGEFYDPMVNEAALADKDASNNGAVRTEE